MQRDAHIAPFQSVILGNLDSAHNLAWWLTRNEHEAADIVQDACLKAWRFFPDYRGGDGKCWLLSIVRTCALSRLRGATDAPAPLGDAELEAPASAPDDPSAPLIHAADRRTINQALMSLPEPLREILILREVEGLSYAQIATVIEAPVGTVMSRLSRARDAARQALQQRLDQEPDHGM